MSRRLIKFLRVCILFLFFHSPFYQVSKKRKKTVRYVQTAFAYDFVQFYMKQPILKFQCSKSKSKQSIIIVLYSIFRIFLVKTERTGTAIQKPYIRVPLSIAIRLLHNCFNNTFRF